MQIARINDFFLFLFTVTVFQKTVVGGQKSLIAQVKSSYVKIQTLSQIDVRQDGADTNWIATFEFCRACLRNLMFRI